MTLQKFLLKPGVNRENTRYTTEGGWYDCDKIRFRQGTPEKIGGWQWISSNTYLGICRSLWDWVTLGGINLTGVGTNLKFYIETGGSYYDVTPIRAAVTLAANPISTQLNSSTVTITDANGGYTPGDFVTFYGATAVGGLTISGQYQIQTATASTYTIIAASTASSTAVGGGSNVRAIYQVNVGADFSSPTVGWGAGGWGLGTWGNGVSSTTTLRIWNQNNFGENLIFGPSGGGIYYWEASTGYTAPTVSISIASPAVISATNTFNNGTPIRFTTTGALPTGLTVGTQYFVINSTGTTFNVAATAGGAAINTSGTQSGTHTVLPNAPLLKDYAAAASVPIIQNYVLVSDINRFVFAFGCNDYGSTTLDPMLIRWSDQEDPFNWSPAATNQAGSLRLSHGSKIITAMQARQEVLVWTDSSVYSLQYQGAPAVWGAQLLGDSISIASQNAAVYASNVAYWMGIDKFYKYDGRVQTLRCDLRQYIFQDINQNQYQQVFSGTNEAYNEAWWFYCSANSTTIDKYVVYNYAEDVWYFGTMARTAWLDSGLQTYPVAATYINNLVYHETGNDDVATGVAAPIVSYITSSEFDLDDGHKFAFIWRVLPDITFRGSNAVSPQVTMYLYPLENSGSGYNDPASVGGTNNAAVIRTATLPIEQFTGQIYTRVRGRQLAMKVESTGLGVAWQLGAPRVDMRPDGRR
ncbi:MAG: hypothetical protein EBR82_35230 [Caulobacteraceae bacterium]|nr:hypothetical protein [Caulobacteraceae bacterium]